MKIELSSDWFAPDSTLYRRNLNPHTVSDDWEDLLPPNTKIVEDEKTDKPQKLTK